MGHLLSLAEWTLQAWGQAAPIRKMRIQTINRVVCSGLLDGAPFGLAHAGGFPSPPLRSGRE